MGPLCRNAASLLGNSMGSVTAPGPLQWPGLVTLTSRSPAAAMGVVVPATLAVVAVPDVCGEGIDVEASVALESLGGFEGPPDAARGAPPCTPVRPAAVAGAVSELWGFVRDGLRPCASASSITGKPSTDSAGAARSDAAGAVAAGKSRSNHPANACSNSATVSAKSIRRLPACNQYTPEILRDSRRRPSRHRLLTDYPRSRPCAGRGVKARVAPPTRPARLR